MRKVSAESRAREYFKRKFINEETYNTAINHREPWDQSDIDYVRKYAGTLSTLELAIALGRTFKSIAYCGYKNNISLAMDNNRRKEVIFYNGEKHLLLTEEQAKEELEIRQKANEDVKLLPKGEYFIIVRNNNHKIHVNKITTRYVQRGQRLIKRKEVKKSYWQ